MGIQINGQTDTIKAIDGTMTLPGTVTYEDVSRVNVTGIVTAGQGLHVTGGSAGIGTASPSNMLHIEGSSPSIRMKMTDGPRHMISPYLADLYIEADNDNTSANTNIIFNIDGSERVRIKSTGELNIKGAQPTIELYEATDTYGWDIFRESADARLKFRYDDGGTTSIPFTITPTSRIGIGTTNPEEIVHIYGPTEAVNSRDGVMLQHSTANANADTGLPVVWSGHIGTQDNYGLASVCGRKENANSGDAAAYLQFATCNVAGSLTERLRITSEGNIGVNTDNPYNSAGYTSLTIDDSTGSQIRMRTSGNERGLIYNTDTEFALYAHNNIPINLYGAGRVLGSLDYEGQFILNSQTNQSFALWRKQSPITLAQYGDYARPVVALSYHRTTGNVNFSGFFGDVIASRGSTGAGHIPIFLRLCVSSAYTTNMRSGLGLGSSVFRFVTFDYDGSSYQGIQYNTDASANILLDGYYATRGFKPFSLAASSVTSLTAVNATTDARLSSTSSAAI